MVNRVSKFLILLLLILVPVTAGLIARYQAIPYWEKNKAIFFVENRPIFSGYDAYLFARYAEDYKRGVFKPGEIDRLRFVPDYQDYPRFIPLISWLSAKLSSLFNTYVENISLWLIPILAVLVAIPIAFLFFKEGLFITALSGGLIATISYIYIARTGIARLDTDSLILFSVFAIPLGIYLFSKAKNLKSKYLSLVLLSFFSLIFYWWYNHPGLNLALLLFGIIYLVLNKYSNYQRNFKLYLRDLDFYLLILAINPIIIAEGIFNLANSLTVYIFKFGLPQNDFPNIYVSISELVHRDLDIIAAWTIGNKYLFLIAVVGLILFAISKFRLFVLLLPILLMGLISLKGASRFAMFLAPMLGIGLGFLIDWLIYKFSLKEKLNNTFYKFIFDLGIIALISAILIWTNLKSFYFKPAPIMTSFLAKTFINLQKITPPNAWIWTWWDYGYAIQYYARRATFHDGGSQGTPKTYFVALSFTTSSPQVGYNVTKSIAVCGLECIKKLLEEGKTAKQITQMFIEGKFIKNAKNLPPIYWLFTGDEISKFAWISYFGTWNFDEKKGYHHSIREIFCAPFGNFNNTYICQTPGLGKFLFEANDFHNAALKFANGKSIPVKFFAIRTPDKLKIFENKFSAYGLAVEKVYTAFKRGNSLTYNWYLTDIVGFKSNFNQMFPLRFWDRKLFEKNYEFYPVGVLYKLK